MTIQVDKILGIPLMHQHKDVDARLDLIENKYEIVELFNTIEEDEGSVIVPKTGGGTIETSEYRIFLDGYPENVDALVSQLAEDGRPNFEEVYDDDLNLVTAALDGNGVYALSSVPSEYPVAIIFKILTKTSTVRNIDPFYILDRDAVDVIPAIKVWNDQDVYVGNIDWVSFDNGLFEGIYKVVLNTCAGESPLTHPEKFKFQGSPAIGNAGDIQMNDGSGGFAASSLNEDATNINTAKSIIPTEDGKELGSDELRFQKISLRGEDVDYSRGIDIVSFIMGEKGEVGSIYTKLETDIGSIVRNPLAHYMELVLGGKHEVVEGSELIVRLESTADITEFIAFGLFGFYNNYGSKIKDFYGIGIFGFRCTGQITNYYGIYVNPAEPVESGTVINKYGIYIAETTTASGDNYAIYSKEGKSYLGGSLGIKVLDPQYELDIDGDINISEGSKYRINGADALENLPTVCEKEAMAGTHGTPCDDNRYVSDSDPRFQTGFVPIQQPSYSAKSTTVVPVSVLGVWTDVPELDNIITLDSAAKIRALFTYTETGDKDQSISNRIILVGSSPLQESIHQEHLIDATIDRQNGAAQLTTSVLAAGTYTFRAQIQHMDGDGLKEVRFVRGTLSTVGLVGAKGDPGTTDHTELINKNAEADVQHLTAAQVAALHGVNDANSSHYTKAESDVSNAGSILYLFNNFI